MTAPTLDALVTPVTPEEALASELTQAALLGLDTTAWQPVSPSRTILAINANIIAGYSTYVNLIAKGGFASYAATITDSNGAEVTTWMDLVSEQVYATTRIPATYAAGTVTLTNSGGTVGPYSAGQLVAYNVVTGAKFANTASVTLANGANAVAVQALVAGSGSTSGAGTITALVTPIVGVTATNAATIVGTDAEGNASLLQRDLAKLGTLSPNGPAQAYYAVATGMLDPLQPWYDPTLTAAITRVKTFAGFAAVSCVIANASGAVSGADVTRVDAQIQKWCVPLGTVAVVSSATANPIAITATIYVPTSAGLSSGAVVSAATSALTSYLEGIDIGGVTGATPNIIPYSELLATIARSVTTTAVTLSAPSADYPLTATEVATLGATAFTVVFV